MNNAISPNPSVPAENAVCQEAPNRWTAAAWALGLRLLRGPVRTRNGRAGDRLVSDLVRMAMVERRGGGWLRITDAGRAAFPTNRCWDYPPETPDCLGTHEWGRLAACDSRPACWRSASASLCRPCEPAPAPSRRSRVPEQIVRGLTTNVADQETVFGLEDLLRRAPAHDTADEAPADGWWPDVGATDKFPAARVGYPTGPKFVRQYA